MSAGARPDSGWRRVVILGVSPELDAGEFAAKRVLGDRVSVSADLVADGQDVITGEILLRRPRRDREERPDDVWDASAPLSALPNDRHSGSFDVDQLGRWQFTIRAWVDQYATWQRGLERKVRAGQNVDVDVLIGAEVLRAAAERASGEDRRALDAAAGQLANTREAASARARAASSLELGQLAARYPDLENATRYRRWLPLWVDRERARFSSWYEFFPRSTGEDGQHGNFETAIARLPYVASMGFNVVYLPPIHPIGQTFRKGKNNSATATESDVGSPYAIGSAEGGHKSVHPALGSLEDFRRFTAEAARHGLEVALDIAFQVTPDHPYVKEHPEWFRKRPDGSIQYAENPPKKYQDIYPFDFESEAWWSLWQELASIFRFWIEQGVRIFRVDNPHTKSLAFWQWCIAELTREHPELIFLAEAFTRPKLMYLLAKLGFTQSYTYFTWRNTGRELSEYVRELTAAPVNEFFRPNFWPITPDILPEHLQYAARPAFALRLMLAATLSSNYGIYGPAFELMDNVPRPGAEEHNDNEKYELKAWQLERSDSLRAFIARVNAIRQSNTALQQNSIAFHTSTNELLLCFSKRSADGENVVLVVANMDVHSPQAGFVDVDVRELEVNAVFGPHASPAVSSPPVASPPAPPARELQLHDLLSDARYFSQERRLFVRLDPASAPAHIFRLRRHARTENDFDYFL